MATSGTGAGAGAGDRDEGPDVDWEWADTRSRHMGVSAAAALRFGVWVRRQGVMVSQLAWPVSFSFAGGEAAAPCECTACRLALAVAGCDADTIQDVLDGRLWPLPTADTASAGRTNLEALTCTMPGPCMRGVAAGQPVPAPDLDTGAAAILLRVPAKVMFDAAKALESELQPFFEEHASSVCSTSEKILTVFLLSEDLRPRNIAGGDTRSSDGRGGGSGDGGAGIDTVGSGTGPGPGSAFTAAPSFWDAHLDVLPGLQTYETMAYVWRPEELRELHHSSFAADMEAPLPALRRSYAEFKAAVDVSLRASRLVDKASPASAPGYVASLERLSRVTFTHFMWASLTILSRTFLHGFCDSREAVVVPMADMMNHTPRPGITDWDHDAMTYDVGCAAALARGAQVLTCYGRRNNSDLLESYGFVMANNPWATVELTVPIPPPGPSQQRRLRVLEAFGSPRYVELQHDAVDADVLTLFRLVAVSDAHFVPDPTAYTGPLPDADEEAAAVQQFVNALQALLRAPTTVDADIATLAASREPTAAPSASDPGLTVKRDAEPLSARMTLALTYRIARKQTIARLLLFAYAVAAALRDIPRPHAGKEDAIVKFAEGCGCTAGVCHAVLCALVPQRP